MSDAKVEKCIGCGTVALCIDNLCDGCGAFENEDDFYPYEFDDEFDY